MNASKFVSPVQRKTPYLEFEKRQAESNCVSLRTHFNASLIRDTREAFLAAEYVQDIENRWRRGAPGQRRAKRLGYIAEFHSGLFGVASCGGFERGKFPGFELRKPLIKRCEMLSRIPF